MPTSMEKALEVVDWVFSGGINGALIESVDPDLIQNIAERLDKEKHLLIARRLNLRDFHARLYANKDKEVAVVYGGDWAMQNPIAHYLRQISETVPVRKIQHGFGSHNGVPWEFSTQIRLVLVVDRIPRTRRLAGLLDRLHVARSGDNPNRHRSALSALL